MGIRKKIFYITAAVMLSVLLVSYGVMYLYFYHVMFEETVIRQRASVELNRQMADNFVQSVYHTAVQLVSDKALGGYLSNPCTDPLETIQMREAVKTQFAHYATHQVIDLSLIHICLLYNYRCDASMEQLYFHVNITQVNGMDLFYGCDTVYEHDAPAEDLEKVLALYRSQRMEDAFLLQGLLWEELGRFIQMADLQEAQTKIYSGMVEQVFRLAQNPVSAGNHVRSLADRLHVSESTLSKRFRAETGMSPGVYLEQLVIQKACRLLIEEDKSMAQIAEELDFSDQFYFTKYFKRKMHKMCIRDSLCGVFETVCTLVMKWI